MMKPLASALLVLLALASCTGREQKPPTATENKSAPAADTSTTVTPGRDTSFRPEVFASFPDTLSGCSSYFTYDTLEVKTGNYIFLTNYRELAMIRVAGKVVYLQKDTADSRRLTEDKAIDVYRGEGYTVVLETQRVRSVDEVSYYTGTLRITSGTTAVHYRVHGEGGC